MRGKLGASKSWADSLDAVLEAIQKEVSVVMAAEYD